MGKRITLTIVAFMTIGSVAVLAEEPREYELRPDYQHVEGEGFDWQRSPLPDWKWRHGLSDHGLDFELVYTGEVFGNARGGINTHDAVEYRGDLSLFMELDTGRAGWWENGLFFLHLQNQHGEGITEDHVGDFQVLSNIDADDFTQLSQIWYRHELYDGRLFFKLGKMEANDDFAFVEYGGEFINSSPGFAPTIPLVTYPDQDWGAVVGVAPADWFSINAGLYQGDPDGGRSLGNTLDDLAGPMVMVEPAFHYNLGDHPGHFRVGAWWNGVDVEELDADKAGEELDKFSSSYGLYLTWDQLVWKENPGDPHDQQGIGLFAQAGWSPEDRMEAEAYYGVGIQWVGPIPTRDDDIAGLGLFAVDFSDEADFEDDMETAVETFYRWQATDWLSFKPDIQYIDNPGGLGNKGALVLGLRVEAVY